MKLDFTGKVVAITGAGGAIGRAMSDRFAECGASVAVCARQESGHETVKLITDNGGKAQFFRMDVTDRQEVKTAIAEIENYFGGLDVLINNAGINVGPDQRFPIQDFSDEKWDDIIKVDLDGVYNCSKAAIPYIQKRGGGSILNISSVVGMVPFRKQCAFTAAKAGVINLTKAMALELAPDNIRVNVISPGSIAMAGTQALFGANNAMEALLSHIPQHRQGNPDEIAWPAIFISHEQYSSYITGTVLNIDGGWLCGYARDF